MTVSRSLGGLAGAAALLGAAGGAHAQYIKLNLVSDGAVPALHTDPNLNNSWGIAFTPNGLAWVADNHTGLSTLYDGMGNANSLVVTVPAAPGSKLGNPTGVVFNGSSTDFQVTGGGGTKSAAFIFASEDGTISGWSPTLSGGNPPPAMQAFRAVDNSRSDAIYKGLAIANTVGGQRLYATDFHNARVDVFDGGFGAVSVPGAFTDPTIPKGFAPFNVQTIGSSLFVTYAKQDAEGEDDDHGPGRGYVDEYDTSGALLRRFASEGVLNSPWGVAQAPANFGALSNALLIGNFGDGRINAFDRTTGQYLGALSDSGGQPIEVDGLWALQFGNGLLGQDTNALFFSSGPDDEAHGLYGRIDVPSPGAGAMLTGMALLVARRRRR